MSQKKRRKRAQRLTSRLQNAGQFETARRLVEAFRLDKEFFVGTPQFTPDEAMADIDEDEITNAMPDLERYIPVEAALPDDLEEEESLVFDTGRFKMSGK